MDCVRRCESVGYDVLPSNRDLAGAEIELVDLDGRELRLKAALALVGAGSTASSWLIVR